jgi:hypothetical protein
MIDRTGWFPTRFGCGSAELRYPLQGREKGALRGR